MIHRKSDSDWIEKAHLKKGALHREMNVPMDKNIPVKRLNAAAKKGGLLGE